MGEEWNTRLAVARLDELTAAHRYREEQPMHGFCLINEDGERCRVTLYIENGRALGDRSGAGGFYYEGWLVGSDGAVSLGAFNLGPGGQGSATRVLEPSALRAGRTELVRVTAEPFGGSSAGSIAVLEGRLVWLDTGALPPSPAESIYPAEARSTFGFWHTAPAELAVPGAVVEEAERLETVLQGVPHHGWATAEPAVPGGGGGAVADAEPAEAAAPESEAVVSAAEPEAEAEAEVAEIAGAVGGAEALESAWTAAIAGLTQGAEVVESVAETPAETVVETMAETVVEAVAETPEPAMAVSAQETPAEARSANPLTLTVQMAQRHPLAPRAGGNATLNPRQGALTLHLRGLPSPTALGRDPSTDRPYNAYRVWLVNQQTNIRTSVGYCQRAWGENFRFQADGLALHRHDAILITVEDRNSPNQGTSSPHILMGSYQA